MTPVPGPSRRPAPRPRDHRAAAVRGGAGGGEPGPAHPVRPPVPGPGFRTGGPRAGRPGPRPRPPRRPARRRVPSPAPRSGAALHLVVDPPHVLADHAQRRQLHPRETHYGGDQCRVSRRVHTADQCVRHDPQGVQQRGDEQPQTRVDRQAQRSAVEGQQPVDAVVQQPPATPLGGARGPLHVLVREAHRLEADPGEQALREPVALRQGQQRVHRPPRQQPEVPGAVRDLHLHEPAHQPVVRPAERLAHRALTRPVAPRDRLVEALAVQLHHARHELRVLQVGVHQDHRTPAGHPHARQQRGFLAEVAAERRVPHPRVGPRQRPQPLHRPVGAAVVDVAHLEREPRGPQRVQHGRVEGVDHLALVEARNDDREVHHCCLHAPWPGKGGPGGPPHRKMTLTRNRLPRRPIPSQLRWWNRRATRRGAPRSRERPRPPTREAGARRRRPRKPRETLPAVTSYGTPPAACHPLRHLPAARAALLTAAPAEGPPPLQRPRRPLGCVRPFGPRVAVGLRGEVAVLRAHPVVPTAVARGAEAPRTAAARPAVARAFLIILFSSVSGTLPAGPLAPTRRARRHGEEVSHPPIHPFAAGWAARGAP